jgi:hypothetical protein
MLNSKKLNSFNIFNLVEDRKAKQTLGAEASTPRTELRKLPLLKLSVTRIERK